MTTPPTKYIVNNADISNTDLSAIFYPLSQGGTQQPNNTGFQYTDASGTRHDLSNLFAAYI